MNSSPIPSSSKSNPEQSTSVTDTNSALNGRSFSEDLKTGQSAEERYIQRLMSLGIKAKRIEGYFTAYDVIDQFGKTHEVKSDLQARKTKNAAFEFLALAHCRAHILAYEFPPLDRFYQFDPEQVRKFILKKSQYAVKPIGEHGEYGVCIPLRELGRIFRITPV